jgi:hypothetical protein
MEIGIFTITLIVTKKSHNVQSFQGLETNGEDEEGIRGFLPEDIIREWRRGARLKCQFCDKKYATIGCCVGKTCR